MVSFIAVRQHIRNTAPMIYSKYALNESERRMLSAVAEACLDIRTQVEFDAWINGPVKHFFPHEMMVCAIGRLSGEEIRIRQLFGVNSPPACMDRFERITNCQDRRIVQRWLLQYRAQVINVGDEMDMLSPAERRNVTQTGVRNIASFGCLDAGGQSGVYFSFADIPGKLTSRHAFKLELLLPYLHQAVTRIVHQHSPPLDVTARASSPLTKRERQILQLVATGMSNRAIAERLSRSELTVQNHLHAIFKKLGVRNRAAAVARCRDLLNEELDVQGKVAPGARTNRPRVATTAKEATPLV